MASAGIFSQWLSVKPAVAAGCNSEIFVESKFCIFSGGPSLKTAITELGSESDTICSGVKPDIASWERLLMCSTEKLSNASTLMLDICCADNPLRLSKPSIGSSTPAR